MLVQRAVAGRLAQLSSAALRMAAAAFPSEPAAVARWLYRFGTLPRRPDVERDFGPDDEPMAVLGMTQGGKARRLLETAYEATTLPGWYSFALATAQTQLPRVCKLYVSPRPEALTDAFPLVVEQFVQFKVQSFKVGRGIEGLLRPDKIIAYFGDREHFEEVATALKLSLRGCPGQGTPFTAETAGHGLLSWGVDPPVGNAAASWRAWITKQLAVSLAAACANQGVDPVTAALAHIARIGVDPNSWIPGHDICWQPNPP